VPATRSGRQFAEKQPKEDANCPFRGPKLDGRAKQANGGRRRQPPGGGLAGSAFGGPEWLS